MPCDPPPGTVVEARRTPPHGAPHVIDRGMIIHAAMNWLVAYFPDAPQGPADPSDPASIRVLPAGQVTAYRDLTDCEPEWVIRTWRYLTQTGPGFLNAPEVIRIWKLAATLAQHQSDANAPTLITHQQRDEWAGRTLTNDDLTQLAAAIPHSSIPEAIGTIVAGIDDPDVE